MNKSVYRILVVEDEPSIREAIVAFLTHLGYHLDEAENGIEALDYVKSQNYHLIILDIKMPYLDGIQFSRSLKEAKLRIPILVITALNTSEIVEQEAGRLIKSFSLENLQAQVEKILEF